MKVMARRDEEPPVPILNKDMTLCISLAGRPSNIGTRFHNYLYEELGLNFVYKAFTTRDLEGAIRGVRALGIRGCSVSMPYKEAVIPLVDELTASAKAIDSVNTIVNSDGQLVAYNTDYEAVAMLISRHALDPAASVLVRGSGGMAKAVVAAFRDAGFGQLTVVARNEAAGRALAGKYGYRWVGDDPQPGAEIIVNVTPLGMNGPEADALAFPLAHVAAAGTVFDVVAFPAETPLVRAARAAGKPVISGAEVIALQAARQFELYTGVRVTADQVARAAAFSRAG
jgi:shikimate dehydrogenase